MGLLGVILGGMVADGVAYTLAPQYPTDVLDRVVMSLEILTSSLIVTFAPVYLFRMGRRRA